jgi:tape measure domain-containing protein
MADLNVALILKLVDRATGPARTAMRALRNIGGDQIMRQAQEVRRGSLMMADGLGTVTGRAARLTGQLASIPGLLAGFGLYQIGSSAIRTASQFERFNVQLTNLEGSSEGAKKAMAWIEDFAVRTPLEMQDTVAAYAKLRAFGIDPTAGSLQALVDTMAATGGDVETMNGLVLAFGQAWTKGKLQGEEAMQMLERGVPVWDILSKAMGKTTAEVVEMSSKGKLGRAEIQLLMDELGKKNAGAAEDMSLTFEGVVSNIKDQWSRFQRMMMDSGLFVWIKGRLQDILGLLNAAAADGRLQAWAESTGHAIITTLKAIWAFGKGVYETWQAVWPVLDGIALSIGGWDVVGWIAVFVLFSGSIWAVSSGLYKFFAGAALVIKGMLGIGGVAALEASKLTRFGHVLGKIVSGGAKMAANAVLWLARAFLMAGRFLMANPIIAVISAIAGLAYVIYQNWNGIVGYFQSKIDAVRAAFDTGLLNGVLKLVSEFNPFKLMIDGAIGLIQYLTGWDLSFVKDMLYAAFAVDLLDTGIAMVMSLWSGIRAKLGEMIAWVKTQLSGIMPDWMKASGGAPTGSADISDYSGVDGSRATGGPVRAGMLYRVNEQDTEMFAPSSDGYIIPNRRLRGARGGTGTSVTVGQITINAAAGMSPKQIARAVRSELEAMARAGRAALDDGGQYA